MTIQEIINELEALKDFTNDHGKRVLDNLKLEIHKLMDDAAQEPEESAEVVAELVVEDAPPEAEKEEPAPKEPPAKKERPAKKEHRVPKAKWPKKKK